VGDWSDGASVWIVEFGDGDDDFGGRAKSPGPLFSCHTIATIARMMIASVAPVVMAGF